MITVAVIGTFDTKGAEFRYLTEQIEKKGMKTITVDLGTQPQSSIRTDFSQTQAAEAAGSSIEKVRNEMSHAEALETMASGGTAILKRLFDEKKISGAVSLGGSQGTFLAAKAFGVLPVGFPKVLVSTVFGHSGLCGLFEGIKDTCVINPIVDIAGMNGILSAVLDSAAAAVCALAEQYSGNKLEEPEKKGRIGLTMWGVTTPCIERMREILDSKGYETYVFHANGMGDKAMEQLVSDGVFTAVADMTTCQLGNTLAGAFSEPVPDRMKVYGKTDIPVLLSVGGMDMLAMVDPSDRLPEKFKGRREYLHGGDCLFVRSTCEENRMIGHEIAARLNRHRGPAKVILPLRGVSANDKEGEVLYDPEADAALFDALKESLREDIEVIAADAHINDPEFADTAARTLIQMIENA